MMEAVQTALDTHSMSMEFVSVIMEIHLLMGNVKDSHVLMLIMCMIPYHKAANVKARSVGSEEDVKNSLNVE